MKFFPNDIVECVSNTPMPDSPPVNKLSELVVGTIYTISRVQPLDDEVEGVQVAEITMHRENDWFRHDRFRLIYRLPIVDLSFVESLAPNELVPEA